MTVLVTGAAGFIGFHVAQRLCRQGVPVVGVDNLNAYYSVALKHARLEQLKALPHFAFAPLDIVDKADLLALFQEYAFTEVIHLAAQAGVRYSLEAPDTYAQANLVGFLNVLEACRHHPVRHLIYASSSSVYGANSKLPFSVQDPVDQPVSLYAASKRANELMAHSYAHLFGVPATGLRFFTVYGPWGRPDMALYRFTRAMLAGQPIAVYNRGDMARDFTYIDDIVESLLRLRPRPPAPAPGAPPCQLFNIGRGAPVQLTAFIECLEQALGVEAVRDYLPMQPGDVPRTWADIGALAQWIDYSPMVPIEQGVAAFVAWYKEFHRL